MKFTIILTGIVLLSIALIPKCYSYDYSLIKHNIGSALEADGFEYIDIDLDGKKDIVVSNSTIGVISWYKQNSLNSWTKYYIGDTGGTSVQGSCVGDVNNDNETEVFIIDKTISYLYMFYQDTSQTPTGSWSNVSIDNNINTGQSCRLDDLDNDGDLDLYYSSEGQILGNGGLYWLEYKGGDVTNVSNWDKHTIKQIEGAWGTLLNRTDINGDGKKEIVFTTREKANVAATGGVRYVIPNDTITSEWELHTIDDTTYVPLHLTIGNFTGLSNLDIVSAGLDDGSTGIYLYNYSDSYSRSVLVSGTAWYNVQAANLDNWGRDELIANDYNGGNLLRVYVYNNVTNTYILNSSQSYNKADDDIFVDDIDKDGYNEIITISQDNNSIDWFNTLSYNGGKITINANTNTISTTLNKGVGRNYTTTNNIINWQNIIWGYY